MLNFKKSLMPTLNVALRPPPCDLLSNVRKYLGKRRRRRRRRRLVRLDSLNRGFLVLLGVGAHHRLVAKIQKKGPPPV
jgi:hypothetical protein